MTCHVFLVREACIGVLVGGAGSTEAYKPLPQASSRGSKAVLSTQKSVNADSLGNWIPELFSLGTTSDMT